MKKITLLIILLIVGLVFAYRYFNITHITAVFDELEPFPKNLNVYYKGFKLGRTCKVYPSKDFTTTHVEMILNANNLNLPENITAKVRSKYKKDYVELEYPKNPSKNLLKNNSVIEGKKCINISNYIDSEAEDGGLDEIKENLNDTVVAAGETLNALTGLIGTANDTLKEVQPSLRATGQNLATMSKDLSEVTGELSRSTKPHRLSNTFANIEQTTKNLEEASQNLVGITQHANTETLTLIDCVVKNTNCLITNLNDIVKGLKLTLSKNFAGMRIIFGKPLS